MDGMGCVPTNLSYKSNTYIYIYCLHTIVPWIIGKMCSLKTTGSRSKTTGHDMTCYHGPEPTMLENRRWRLGILLSSCLWFFCLDIVEASNGKIGENIMKIYISAFWGPCIKCRIVPPLLARSLVPLGQTNISIRAPRLLVVTGIDLQKSTDSPHSS